MSRHLRTTPEFVAAHIERMRGLSAPEQAEAVNPLTGMTALELVAPRAEPAKDRARPRANGGQFKRRDPTKKLKPLKLTHWEPSETAVQAAIQKALSLHFLVAWIERVNSGAMKVKDEKTGKYRFVRFHTIKGCTDLIGQMRSGLLLVIEVKPPSWTHPTDDREYAQEAFIERVVSVGGIGGFARSVMEAIAIVEERTI